MWDPGSSPQYHREREEEKSNRKHLSPSSGAEIVFTCFHPASRVFSLLSVHFIWGLGLEFWSSCLSFRQLRCSRQCTPVSQLFICFCLLVCISIFHITQSFFLNIMIIAAHVPASDSCGFQPSYGSQSPGSLLKRYISWPHSVVIKFLWSKISTKAYHIISILVFLI